MATLQKFKLLATQCALSASPSRSPNASPVFQLRRRKTLKRLLSRSSSRRFLRRGDSPSEPARPQVAPDPPENKPFLSHTLKDLFVSSPPPDDKARCSGAGSAPAQRAKRLGLDGLAAASRRAGVGTGAFRYRMLRRAWRPVLLTIPE